MGYHYVPQRFLRNFQDPSQPGTIWLYLKSGGPGRHLKIESVAQARGYYPDDTERFLNLNVEIPGSGAIEKLLERKTISPEERRAVAYYIAVMNKRGPKIRRKANEHAPDVLVGILARVRAVISQMEAEGALSPEMVDHRRREVDEVEKRYAEEIPQDVMAKAYQPWPGPALVQAIMQMNWQLLWTAGPLFFVTSDTPVFFYEDRGVGNRNSELYFPISSRCAIYGCRQGKTRGRRPDKDAPQSMVREINKRLISHAEYFVLFREPSAWVEALITSGPIMLRDIGLMPINARR